jgi:hypothetical protein
LGDPQVPYGDPQVPEVPYGGADPVPVGTAPRWLRRLFDEPASPEVPSTGSLPMLAEPPRPVPLAYRLAALSLGGWELFTLLMALVAPIALWIAFPLLRSLALVVGATVLVVTRLRRSSRRVGILRWGRVATVTSRSARRSSSSYTNWPMRQARGWDVTTVLHPGGGTTTDVEYTVDAQSGRLRVRGLPYADGVVLADSLRPERAMVVSQFPHSVKPGLDGQLVGWLAPGRWAWVVLSLLLELGLVALAAWTVLAAVGA